ncbi:MAG: iron-containing alcohol dehydrogenase family protein [Lachnospiraceae bacterium]
MDGYRMVVCGTSWFGAGKRAVLPEEAAKRGLKKALLVTDPGIVSCGVAGKVEDVLKKAGIPYEVFDGIKPNPTIENVQDGERVLKESGADYLVAVGGGSVIDTAEAMAIIATNPENADVASLEGMDKNARPGLPLFALPTTAGTGSETTMDFVITNTKEKRKMACMSATGIPTVAILDTELMAGLPVKMSAATGMDAMTHAVESYLAKGANTITELYSIESVRLAAAWLPAVIENPKDLNAREKMAVAEYLAGASFTNAGLGIVHSMAHPLSAFYDIPHGIANALILPYGLSFNADAAPDKVKKLADAMAPGQAGDDPDKNLATCCEVIRGINKKAGLPATLRELGVKEADLPLLAKSALEDVSTLDNPKEVTVKDLENLYRAMY